MFRYSRSDQIYRSRLGFAVDQVAGVIREHCEGAHFQFGKVGNYLVAGLTTAISPLGVAMFYVMSFDELERVDPNRNSPPVMVYDISDPDRSLPPIDLTD